MRVIVLGFLLILSSCGVLVVNPKGCRDIGFWAGPGENEEKFTEQYFVWNQDHEVQLKEFFKKRNINCSEIKKMRVDFKSVFFVKRELTVFIQK
jgi:hypothetical protein